MVQPGDHATFTVELIQPIAMEEGLTFAVREGGHTVGLVSVGTKILAWPSSDKRSSLESAL